VREIILDVIGGNLILATLPISSRAGAGDGPIDGRLEKICVSSVFHLWLK
jgi:hypothetical protein